MRRIWFCFLVLILASVISVFSGCDDKSGGSSRDSETPGQTDDPIDGPAITGFDFSLASGDFWEYRWDYYHESTSDNITDSGRFWVVLGDAVQIEGRNAYEVLMYGRSKQKLGEDIVGFGPRWKYLAMSDGRIYGSNDGSSLVTLFDAETGSSVGGGFFREFPDSDEIVAEAGTINSDNPYISGTAIVLSNSVINDQCEYYGEYGTICSDNEMSTTIVETEYYREAIGPIGYFYLRSYTSTGGGIYSYGTWEHNVGMTASSFSEDPNPLIQENEPDDLPLDGMQLSFQSPVIGSVLASTTQGSLKQISAIVTDDNGDEQTIYPIIEDWYRLTLTTQQTVTISLSFESSTTSNLDLFLCEEECIPLEPFGCLPDYPVISYSVHNNPARGDQNEVISVNLPAGYYYIAVDANVTPGVAEYTLQVE